jgi:hypothetical protein
MMRTIKHVQLDNLSNLDRLLKKAEAGHVESSSEGLRRARSAIMGTLRAYRHSRFEFGRTLREYKRHFKAHQGWVAAAKVIGTAIDRDEKTIFRIVADYERAARLPEITIDALLDQNIDPAARKNAPIIEELLQGPMPKTTKQALKIVGVAREQSMAKKRKAPAKSITMDFEDFAARVVKQLEERYRTVTPEQKESEIQYLFELANCTLRLEIRELRQFARPALVPKPRQRAAA